VLVTSLGHALLVDLFISLLYGNLQLF
jgi:hypothetical protein